VFKTGICAHCCFGCFEALFLRSLDHALHTAVAIPEGDRKVGVGSALGW